jgi:hypothetical protein
MKVILSIVPRLPPAVDGVGDYACVLAESLATTHNIATQFIACDPLHPIQSQSEKFSSIQLPQRSSDSLLSVLDRYQEIDTLFLHYVGYGYAQRGCPLWLLSALTNWRQANSNRRIVIMFHEVYASSSQPWNSQFWTSPIQRKIAKDLVNLCDAVITNNQLFADLLKSLSRNQDLSVHILPIFSNIGECSQLKYLEDRQPWLVTFGNAGFRRSIYKDSIEQLTTICQQLGIKEIYDIGHNSVEIVRAIPQVKVNPMGILPAAAVSQVFQMAQVGFLNYPVSYIAKSSIFAAYSSHRLLSVFDRHNLGDNQDGVNLREHYWSALNPEDRLDLASAQAIADRAYQWYDRHNLSRVTSQVATILNQISA